MWNSLILFAQAEAEKGGEKPPAGPFDNFLIPMLLVGAAFFFLIVLPGQRRQKKEQEALLANLKKNDEVLTAAGIIGTVHLIHEGGEQVTLKIDDNARMRVLRTSIVKILTPPAPAGTTPAAPASPTGITNKPNA
jgi:preprotein translocase subunit YajC